MCEPGRVDLLAGRGRCDSELAALNRAAGRRVRGALELFDAVAVTLGGAVRIADDHAAPLKWPGPVVALVAGDGPVEEAIAA